MLTQKFILLSDIKQNGNLYLVMFIFAICDVIKQNESLVGSDMLLVSDYIYISHISQQNLKPDTCVPLQY